MSEHVIRGFWAAMGTNDFARAAERLHPNFEYYMPQSGEYLRGRDAFVAVNAEYPAQGSWHFTVRSVIADGARVVSDVEVTDGAIRARAITFHEVHDGLILRQREYWPDDYPAPAWRAHLVKIVETPPF